MRPHCLSHRNGKLHKLALLLTDITVPKSLPHQLPWLKEDDEFKKMYRDYMLYDRNDLDLEDEYVLAAAQEDMDTQGF